MSSKDILLSVTDSQPISLSTFSCPPHLEYIWHASWFL